jgi:hypothetical protein
MEDDFVEEAVKHCCIKDRRIHLYLYFCGLVVKVPDYRSRGPGSIPGTTRFSEK